MQILISLSGFYSLQVSFLSIRDASNLIIICLPFTTSIISRTAYLTESSEFKPLRLSNILHHFSISIFHQMDKVPAEVLIKVFETLSCLDLARTHMRVCKEWSLILGKTTSVWRHLNLEQLESEYRAYQIIKHVNQYSESTIKSVKIEFASGLSLKGSHGYGTSMVNPILTELERSRTTLKSIDIFIRGNYVVGKAQDIFTYFRSFPNLENLNLSPFFTPQAKRPESHGKGKLVGLGVCLVDDNHQWKEEDLNWLSSLKTLLVSFEKKPTSNLPSGALARLVQACGSSLEEFWTELYLSDMPIPDSLLWLPNLKNFGLIDDDFENWNMEIEAFNFPKILQVAGTPQFISAFPFNKLISLRIQVKGSMTEKRAGAYLTVDKSPSDAELLEPLKVHDSSLESLQLFSPLDQISPSVDAFLLHLIKVTGRQVSCPRLSILWIDEKQVFSSSLLAIMVVSRRLSSKVDGPGSCSNLVLYMPPKYLESFRKWEERFLSLKSVGGSRLVGRSEVRSCVDCDWH